MEKPWTLRQTSITGGMASLFKGMLDLLLK